MKKRSSKQFLTFKPIANTMNKNEKTLRGLFQEEKYDYIYIPRIQRDYAQGRKDEEATIIRDNILDDVEKKRPLSWGIIFGVSENKTFEDGTERKCFIPVDGQQRLTTLYLLNLYADKRHQISFEYADRFSYETRNASKDFISALVCHWDGGKEDGIQLKEHLVNQGWFLYYWMLDPTVDAMLNMLTAIDSRFREHRDVFENLDRISFEFLDLNNLELNETLYIKMNSRGRKLSEFDKIKSEIDKILLTLHPQTTTCYFELYRDIHLDTLPSFAEKWRYCIDRKWSDMFWNKEKYTYDAYFLSFLTNYLIGSVGKDYVYVNKLLEVDFKKEGFFLPWKYFGTCLTSEENADAYLKDMAAILNKLTANGPNDIVKELILLPDTYTKRAWQFGLLSFQGTDYSSEAFQEWHRFIYNYATNTVEDKDTFFAFTKRIKEEFSSRSTDILTYLAGQYDSEKVDDRSQLSEEYFKASLLLQGGELGQKIREAEGHPLLNGRLRPLLAHENHWDAGCFLTIWKHFLQWFGPEGDDLNFREGDTESLSRRVTFATAFVKSLTQWNQLFNDNCKILGISYHGLKENLRHQRFEAVFRMCLLADQLSGMEEAVWSNPEESEAIQTKETLLKPGVIAGILSHRIGTELRFRWYHNCSCFFPYNGKSPDDRIGFDRINSDPLWRRNRNQVVAYLTERTYSVQNERVSTDKGVALWWGSDIFFTHPQHPEIQLWWNADYHIGIIHSLSNTTWVKRHQALEGNENLLFNAIGKDERQIEECIEELIKDYTQSQ